MLISSSVHCKRVVDEGELPDREAGHLMACLHFPSYASSKFMLLSGLATIRKSMVDCQTRI